MVPTRHTKLNRQRSAFTLVELLVVIGIIAALASLLLVAGGAAIRAAREAAIKTECTQLADGFQKYTNDISGGAYPPNLTGPPPAVSGDAFMRHFRKCFTKQRESQDLLTTLATGVSTGTATMHSPSGVNYPQTGISPYEAVVFWLGGFSNDSKYPISGPNGPSYIEAEGEDLGARNKTFDFDESRLGPRSNNLFDESRGRYVTYTGPNGENRRINLWWYTPTNLTVPYAYFDASTKPKYEIAYTTDTTNSNPNLWVAPIVSLKTGSGDTYVLGNLRLANDGRCQILAAGLDDSWGQFSKEQLIVDWSDPSNTQYNGLVYPDGPWTGELADTITNFSTNRTLEDSQP